ncbi:MAG TPA: methanol/ethanol family PQQ-dependent dehydrogenase [Longimicrobiales bacterium]|nr:methanol/ethanol family PQQ-dependent dehydrogenase [Longimicrobiales bacterium]
MRKFTSPGSWAFPAAALLALSAAPAVAQDLLQLQQDPNQWVVPGKDYALTRYSPLNQINASNVKTLKVAWTFSTGTLNGLEGAPLVLNNTMYFVSSFPNIVYALDLSKEGAPIKWLYKPTQDPTVPGVACCDLVNRGVAYADGKIFVNQLDATTLALDANTGQVVWQVKQGDPKRGQTITGAPLVIKDKVISGISGGEFGVRGFVTANDIKDGHQVWRMYSTGPDAEVGIGPEFKPFYKEYKAKDLGVTTWKGEQWKLGGGTTWGWYSYDPELNLLYYGSGNPGTWNPDQRPGDNKWSMSIWARNPDNGQVRWVYQMTPHDAWDYDGVNEMILVDQVIDGKPRKTLVHFDRNGFGYTLDRVTGEVLVAEPYGPVNWAKGVDLKTGRPIEDPTKRTKQGQNTTDICPSAMGFKDQQPASYSPKTKLFYVPTNNLCMEYEGVEVSYTAGVPYVGAIVKTVPGPGGHRGALIAWDATTGKKVWANNEKWSAWSGTLNTGGDIVFYGTMDGWFKAVSPTTGQELWKFKTGAGIIGAPMTFVGPDGKQYVAILAGVGGWSGATVSLDLPPDDPTAALGAVNAFKDLTKEVAKSGMLYVFALP